MLSRSEASRLDRKLMLAFRELPISSTSERLGQLAAICHGVGRPIELGHGIEVPDPEVSLRLLGRAATEYAEIDWLSSRLTVDDDQGCWALPLAAEYDSKKRARYPTITNHVFGAKSELAHRFVTRRMFGPLKTREHLDHLCRVHACCNPTHLEVVTTATNNRRGVTARTFVTGQGKLY